MPIVSVIVPCFNHGRTLNEAVASALDQTLHDLEVVVVDDGSTDPYTKTFFETYRPPPRTRLFRGPNRGKSSALNRGIRESEGRYLLVLDADDKLGSTYAEKAIAVLEARPDVGIVYCDAEYFGKRSGPWDLPEFDFRLMLRRNLIFQSAFFRRADWERAGGFSEHILSREDYDFWLKLLERQVGVHRIPEVLFYYRKHWVRHRSKSKRLGRRAELEVLDRIYRNHPDLYAAHVDVLFDQIRALRTEIAEIKERRLHERLRQGVRAWRRPTQS